jgi:hypothetical protein
MQRGRQQDMSAARGDVTQFRHRKVCWDGLIIGNQNIFFRKKTHNPPIQVKWSFPKTGLKQ